MSLWAKRAQKRTLEKKIREIHLSRMPWMEAKDLNDELAIYQSQLEMLKSPDEKLAERKIAQAVIDQNWEEMKRKGKG